MRKLVYLTLASKVQEICKQQKEEGIISETEIFFNSVMKKVPVCLNTYRKMLKEDLSDLPRLTKEYRDREYQTYLDRLDIQSRKRVK